MTPVLFCLTRLPHHVSEARIPAVLSTHTWQLLQEAGPTQLLGCRCPAGREIHTRQLPCCWFRPSELMGVQTTIWDCGSLGVKDEDARAVGAVRADVGREPCSARLNTLYL